MAVMEWHGDEYLNALDRMVYNALWQIGGDLQTESVNECPIDTGALRKSCAYVIERNGTDLVLTVGYGHLPYAWKQHETPWYNHPRGGKWKYLEDPFNRNMPRYKKHIEDILVRLGKGERQ